MKIEVDNLGLKQNQFSFLIKKWSLEPNSHVLIEGPSGSEETSFLHLLAGLVPPISGSIRIDDTRVDQLSKNELCQFRRENLGIIFQKIHLLPHLTVLENVILGANFQNSKKEAIELLNKLNLKDRLHHLPKELSLGETQRASIARALISDPKMILADEPTASLDDENANAVFKLLKEKAKGKSLLIVTHDHRAKEHFQNSVNFKELLK